MHDAYLLKNLTIMTNFRALLRYLLKEHITTCRGNAMYTSQTVQNEIISIIGTTVQEAIVNRASKEKYYTVLADEISDVQCIEQFSLCIRSVDPKLIELRDDFLSFVPVYDVSGAELANTIKENLVSLGLDMNRLRG
ncbi:hypothetical protein PR048_014566 [Dryococelus australis]|uniref:DUF4371 domain-containing protein n=1 Tax=Dryococelus australis TaxID=614101 RepID=A0ABQ9HEL6_9NEOP|nr:hypothetical protein PR048_014566 [Dryococelus australis]